MPRRKKQITDVNNDNQEPVLDDIDNKILNIVTADPTINPNQIGNKLIQLGVAKSPQLVYNRLNKNIYLRGEIQRLRDAIKEDHSRVIFPLAHKRMKEALKNKDLHDKDVFQYVKLAYDKELSTKEETNTQVNTQVNIDSLQVMINKALE
jgi:precorrin-6B methylase 1